jgi:hypothetical protein
MAASSAWMLALGALSATPAHSAPARCATTTDRSAPAAPVAGAPCWTDVDPYPFGGDGEPVDFDKKPECRPNAAGDPNAPGDKVSGVSPPCYLTVDSMAFRAWNRGLAATSVANSGTTAPTSLSGGGVTTAFGVWLFNGTRWFPDPTFPGQTVCPGSKVLWAGKLDYWLIGVRPATESRPDQRKGNWPRLCRFDGVNFAWQPVDVPQATRDRVLYRDAPPAPQIDKRKSGAIRTGSCLAWDDCWFFGDYGAVVHWDGNVLSDASPDLASGATPWLGTDYTAAVARAGGTAGTFGVAVGTTGGTESTPTRPDLQPGQLPAQPDGSPAPQLFLSGGGPFSPLPFWPPTLAQPGDPERTDLVAADFNAQGQGWVAGDPVGSRAGFSPSSDVGATVSPSERRGAGTELAPLVPVSPSGTASGCAGPVAERFTYTPAPDGNDAYLWSSLSVFQDSGRALAGGQMRPAAAGPSRNDDGLREPVLVTAACDGTVATTRFRIPDQTVPPAGAPLVPANRGGTVTSLAANAGNDAWAATTVGFLRLPSDPANFPAQRPRLYRLTDGAPPTAPAGDDDEPRPLVLLGDPDIFVDEPPPPEPPPPPDTTVTQQGSTTNKTVKLKAAVYHVVASKARRIRGGRFVLEVRFRLRRPVTIGLQGLRRGKVVISSGFKRFTGTRGKLTLKLDRRHWPTRLRFVMKSTGARGGALPEYPLAPGARP